MLKLFLLRHGETDFNKQRIVQGSGVDASLNELGLLQAQKFFDHYKNTPFEAVYCSTLQRSYQTIKHFELLYCIQRDPALNELSWGIIEGKPFEGEVEQMYWEVNRQWANGNLEAKIPQGDSPDEILNRVHKFIEVIKKKHQSNVLICTHGRILKILLAELLGYSLKYQDLFTHYNTSLTILKYVDDYHFIVEKFNDISHLEGI